ncbi:MAG: transcriptional repressor LexA [Candidatus Eisenbacteria bacterium]|uniref:LexA repressor n=1 Tax=Eiseniibacteriota bacterium TaxID=2212470 RepID=A0A948WCK0_UNCEI|nr:transcriptional repressor LexA [Candidatus Eisenbacteria bacterium]
MKRHFYLACCTNVQYNWVIMKTMDRVLRTLNEWISECGAPPTLRELAQALGFRSTNSVRYHLRRLERAGLVRRHPGMARGFVPVAPSVIPPPLEGDQILELPILGRVAAGTPISAEENREGSIVLDPQWRKRGAAYALIIKGNSMRDAGIYEGDLALVRPQCRADHGSLIVALLDGEATVKRLELRGNQIRLCPSHPDYEPIPVSRDSRFSILGKVVGIIRQYPERAVEGLVPS